MDLPDIHAVLDAAEALPSNVDVVEATGPSGSTFVASRSQTPGFWQVRPKCDRDLGVGARCGQVMVLGNNGEFACPWHGPKAP